MPTPVFIGRSATRVETVHALLQIAGDLNVPSDVFAEALADTLAHVALTVDRHFAPLPIEVRLQAFAQRVRETHARIR